MNKALLIVIMLLATFTRKSSAQVSENAEKRRDLKRVSLLIDSANIDLRHDDTIKAIARIKLCEAYLPQLSPGDALSLQNRIFSFYLNWVKFKNPPSRGQADEHAAQITSLINLVSVKPGLKSNEKAFFNNAVKLAAAAKNRSFYWYTKTRYAESLVKTGEHSAAIPILDSLSNEPSLSDYEKMHILSLLIINKVKLGDSKNLDKYEARLQTLNKSTHGKLNQPEYLLATAMYLDKSLVYVKAIAQYQSLLARYGKQDNNDSEPVTEGMIRLASLWAKLQKPDSATYYFSKADQVIKNNKQLKEAKLLYTLAFTAYQRSIHKIRSPAGKILTEDTAYRGALQNATKQLEYRYRLEVKNQQLKLMAQQSQLEALKYTRDRQQSILIILGLLVLVIAAAASGYVMYLRRKQAQVLHQAELENMKQAHHIEAVNLLASTREEERGRIAGRLHDEIGSMLTVARLNLSVVAEDAANPRPVSPAQLAVANNILNEVAITIREMSHELMPLSIRQLGLKKSIQQLADDINTANKIIVDCVIVGLDDTGRYPLEFQTNIYYIVRELFQNIIRHAGANHAAFQLVEHADALNMMMEDNGRGMDIHASGTGKGFELLNNHIALYNGEITIEPGANNGTLIIIDIPLQNIVYSGQKNGLEYGETLPG